MMPVCIASMLSSLHWTVQATPYSMLYVIIIIIMMQVGEEDVRISLEKSDGQTVDTFINYSDMAKMKTSIHKEPFLVVIQIKLNCLHRLNSFISGLLHCPPSFSKEREFAYIHHFIFMFYVFIL